MRNNEPRRATDPRSDESSTGGTAHDASASDDDDDSMEWNPMMCGTGPLASIATAEIMDSR